MLTIKPYQVRFSYTVIGSTEVSAFSEKNAKDSVREKLEEEGLEGLYEMNVTDRNIITSDAEEIIS
jgi:hypothetical protein